VCKSEKYAKKGIVMIQKISKLLAVVLFIAILTGCATQTHSRLIFGESEKTNDEAITNAQTKVAVAEGNGCKAMAISGGPALAVGLVIGEACIECQPLQQTQRRQSFIVNVLMQCPGAANGTRN
jgi:hypothetical protein